MKRPDTPYIQVGIITAAHGVRGEVKIRSLSDNPEDIFTYGDLTDSAGQRHFRVKRRGGHDRLFNASVEGIADRNAAELLKGTKLFISADRLPKQKENRWHAHELIGLEARLSNGKAYGRIAQIYNFGAGDIIEITLAGGKTEMLPFDSDFTGDVHAEEGYLIVFPPDYVETEG